MQLSRQTAHILAVEDCPEDARLIKAAIKRADVDVSLRGVEAVRYLRGDGKYRNRREFPSPTFALCDVKMPEMDGLQLLRWVRSHPDCSGYR
jgi:CheY-like chemotaxis protein